MCLFECLCVCECGTAVVQSRHRSNWRHSSTISANPTRQRLRSLECKLDDVCQLYLSDSVCFLSACRSSALGTSKLVGDWSENCSISSLINYYVCLYFSAFHQLFRHMKCIVYVEKLPLKPGFKKPVFF